MILVTYNKDGREQLSICIQSALYDTNSINAAAPATMAQLLQDWDAGMAILKEEEAKILSGERDEADCIAYADAPVMAAVPHPTSCRDGYAFRQHVAAARRNRKVDMIPEFDQDPIFYFTNHNSIQGPGEISVMPDHLKKLDFELEAAIVICKKGRNIPASEADNYIGGYMIMNDMSARTLQMEEMLLNLGPAKGKDFCTVLGAMLVTPDELENQKIPAKPGHTGNNYNLKMQCLVNNKLVSEGNMGDMDWTFAEIIERCSYGVDVHAGDVIGSGTVGTGCFLELNGTGKLNDPNYQEQWLQDGDVVVCTVQDLGSLTNNIVAEKTDWSILNLKKK
jgi:fumarylacetoacetate (FAA) hydrolase